MLKNFVKKGDFKSPFLFFLLVFTFSSFLFILLLSNVSADINEIPTVDFRSGLTGISLSNPTFVYNNLTWYENVTNCPPGQVAYGINYTGEFLCKRISDMNVNSANFWDSLDTPDDIISMAHFRNSSDQIPSNLINKTTGTSYLGQLLDTILDSIKTYLDQNNASIYNVNTTLNAKIDNVNLTLDTKINTLDTKVNNINSSLYSYIFNVNLSLDTKINTLDIKVNNINITLDTKINTLVTTPNLHTHAWANLTNFPSDCAINNYATGLNNTSIKCTTFGTLNVNSSIYSNYSNYANSSDYWDNLDTPYDILESIYWYNHTLSVWNLWGKWFYNQTIPSIAYTDLRLLEYWNISDIESRYYNKIYIDDVNSSLTILANSKAFPGECPEGFIVNATTTTGVTCVNKTEGVIVIETDPIWTANSTLVRYKLEMIDASNISNEYWVNETGDTMTGNLIINNANLNVIGITNITDVLYTGNNILSSGQYIFANYGGSNETRLGEIDGDGGLWRPTGNMRFHVNDSNNFLFTGGTLGTEPIKVGIGTKTPTAPLTLAFGPLQITAKGTPTGGAGIEIEGNASGSEILSYNRTTSSFLPLVLRGSNITLTQPIAAEFGSYVGIGTYTPAQKLDVNGSIIFSGLIYGNGSQLTDVLHSYTEIDPIWTANSTLVAYLSNQGNWNVNSSNYWDNLDTPNNITSMLNFYNKTETDSLINTSSLWNLSGSNLYPRDLGYNVGIGTASPVQELHVIGTGAFSTSVVTPKLTAGEGSTEYGNLSIKTVGPNPIKFYTENTEHMILDPSGNLGIGTSTPSAKLDVEVSSGGATTIGSSANTATGNYAVAMGESTNASGSSSTAMGSSTKANNVMSTALGGGTVANGAASIAMGFYTTASGQASTAMGAYTTANNDYSTAIGTQIIVNGTRSVGIGLDNTPRTITNNSVMAIMGGNVGIGTVSPTQTLDVNGNVSADYFIGDGSLLTGISGGNSSWNESYANTKYVFKTGDNMTGSLKIDGELEANNTLYVKPNWVGINTETPTEYAKLDVYANSGTSLVVVKSGDSNGGLQLHSTEATYPYISFYKSGTPVSWILNDYTNNNLALFTGSSITNITNGISITPNGDVGIGTGSPSQKLHVKGNINITGYYYGDGSQLTGIGAGAWTLSGNNLYPTNLSNNVGIGTSTPSAKLDVEVLGEGGAATIGSSGNTATGNLAIAMGSNTNASGDDSVAMGLNTKTTGLASTATGQGTTASGLNSFAMGSNTIASAEDSITMGVGYTNANLYSLGIGYNNLDILLNPNGDSWFNVDTGNVGIGIAPSASATPSKLTVAGDVNLNNTLYVNQTSNYVGIGTAKPTHKLNVVGAANITSSLYSGSISSTGSITATSNIAANGNYITADSDGTYNIRLGEIGGYTGLYIPSTDLMFNVVNGNLRIPTLDSGTGTALVISSGVVYISSSSERYKKDIKPFKDNFSKILSAEPKSFIYKDSNQTGIGYIAEDFDKLGLNKLVEYNKDNQTESIYYDKISLYLVEVIKEQQKDINNLKTENNELKNRIGIIEAKLNKK